MSTLVSPLAMLRSLGPRERAHLLIVALCTGAAIGHQASMWTWFIEDAAISFAYAKHFAEGHGFVSFVGGERVEGFSNPLWTFTLVLLYWVGFDLFQVVRWVQVLQALVTVPVAYLIGREAFRDRPDNDAVLLVPALVAGNAQFAIWGTAGLENGQLNMLMTLAIWRMLVEARTGSFPWSALLWLGVALSRPETILYAAVGGTLSMLFHLREGRGLKPAIQWLLLFWPPLIGVRLAAYEYFAWPFPNTYYAKVEHREDQLPGWGKRPFLWSQRWAHEMGHGYFMPVYLFGLLGHGAAWRVVAVALTTLVVGGAIQLSGSQRVLLPVVLGSLYMFFGIGLAWNGARAPRGLIGGGLVGIALLFGLSEFARYQFGFVPNQLPTPSLVKELPPYLLALGGLLLPWLSLGAPGWRARVTAWGMCFAAAFFAIYVEYDWMKGFRWYSTAAVPGAVLLALGTDSMLHTLATWLDAHRSRFALGMGYGWGLVFVAGFSTLHGYHTYTVADKPDARPEGVHTRVRFVDSVRDELFVDDERWKDLDVDMGAHLYWSDFHMLDIAGLIDVPMGHQKFDRDFIREYLFQEERPHFAHVHGAWASTSRIPSHPEWKRDYVEIPGFPAGSNQFHIGNYLRKDLLLVDTSPFPATQRRPSTRGLTFEGFDVPVNPAKARAMYVEVGVRRARQSDVGNFRLLMSLKGPGGHDTFDLPPAYDWWMPDDWTPDKMFHGRYGVPLPPHLAPGVYDVAFVILDEEGAVVPLGTVDEGASPILARGEAFFPAAVTIVTPEERAERAVEDREAAIAAAEAGRCDEATRRWFLARRSRPLDEQWLEEHLPRVNAARAACELMAARATDDVNEQVDHVARARFLVPLDPEVWALGRQLADPLVERGKAALDQGEAACAEHAPPFGGRIRFLLGDYDPQAHATCLEKHKSKFDEAYRSLTLALRADPSRAWARRWAEEARSVRLKIDPAHKELHRRQTEARRADVEARRKAYEKKKEDKVEEADEEAVPEGPGGGEADEE